VANFLVAQGVSAGSVTSEGEGSSQPIASNDTEAGRAENRRTEIKVD
jgi:outer membrane protein OmpA-like peptidoglycan-associated protein